MTRSACIAACALILTLAAPRIVAQQPAATQAISTLLQDAQALAASGVPFGVVLGKDDSLSMQVWRPARPAAAAVSSQTLKTEFAADWRERFHIAEADAVLSAVSVRASVCDIAAGTR